MLPLSKTRLPARRRSRSAPAPLGDPAGPASPEIRPTEQNRGARSLVAEAVNWLNARPRLVDALAVLLVAGGGALRFYRSTALSYWLDEGYTLLFSRLPWDTVLGLNGAYDVHPPLYYALVKAVSIFMPEIDAGRYLSVFAGTATLAVLYMLVARIGGKPPALVAILVAAVSPLDVWYSQEARQYAVTGLAVSVAYLALAAFYVRPRMRWAVAYGVALASAVYLDYSALYALAPQVILLPFVVYRHRRGAVPMIVAGAAAVVAYLPWLPNVFGTVHALGNDRASYLEADPNFFKEEFFSVLGFNGQGIYFASPLLSPWDRWSAFHPLFWALSLGGIALGGWALMRHRFAVTLAFALLIGTLVAAYLFSQISPGFAPRTVSYAVLGWAILLGAAAAGGGISISRRVIGWVVVVAMVVVSAASLQAESQGHKQDWRSWATGVADAAHLGYPIVYFPSLAATFADAYQPGSLSGAHFEVDQVTDLSGLGSFVNGQQAFWFASTDLPERVTLDPFFRSQGFERALSHQYPADLLSLDLYVRSGVNLGSPLAIDEGFTQTTGKALGWQLPTGRSSISPGAGGPELTLSNPGGIEVSALLTIPGSALHLYSLTLEARSRLASGSLRAFLVCEGGGEALSLAPDQAGANVPADSSWHTISFSTFCPDGSDEVRVDLRDAGVGDLDLRGVEIYEAAPAWHG